MGDDHRRQAPLAPHAGSDGHVAEHMVRFPRTHGTGTGLKEIRAFFQDDHVHMALIIADDGRLVTTIERSDLSEAQPGCTSPSELGTLRGRTVGPTDSIHAATRVLAQERRRRLAVVDGSGQLLGLLCLKKDGTGYCSDEGIRERGSSSTGSLSTAR